MATAARDPVEIEDAQHRLAVAEGLLSAIRTPRGLAAARKLLENDALTTDEARAELTGLIGGLRKLPLRATSGKKGSFHGMHGRQSAVRKRGLTKGEGATKCAVCGATKPASASICPKCHDVPTTGHDPPQEQPYLVTGELRAADTTADFPLDQQASERRPRRRRRRRKEKAVETQEARVTGNPSVPGSPSSQTGPEAKQNEDWGGPNAAATLAAGGVPLTKPPNLREAEGWKACANCVFFNKAMCNLYGFDREGQQADSVHRGGYPVDRDDLCDSHDTVTPPDQQGENPAPRYADRWLRETQVIAEAEAVGDVEVLMRARAREAHLRGKLEEFGFHLPGHFDPGKHPRSRGGKFSETMNAVSKLKPGESHQVGPSVHIVNDHQFGYSVMSHGSAASRHGSDAADAARYAHELADRAAARKRMPSRERHDRFLHASAEEETMDDLSEVKSDVYPGLDRSPKKNWVENAGGLPRYMERVAKHLHYEGGKPISKAIQMAVGIVKRWCEGGGVSAHGVHGANVKADTKAKACAAVAEWNAKRAKTKARKVTENWHDELEMEEALYLLEEADAVLRPIPPSINYCAKILGLVENAYDDWDDWKGGLPPEPVEEADYFNASTFPRDHIGRFDPSHHPRGRGGRFRDALARLSKDLGRGRSPHPKGESYHGMERRMDGRGHGAGESIYRGGPAPKEAMAELEKIKSRFKEMGMTMPSGGGSSQSAATHRAVAAHHRAIGKKAKTPREQEVRSLLARRSEIRADILDHANRGALLPRSGGTETGADDAAVSPKTVEQHFASGKKKPSAGAATSDELAIDHAVGQVLQNFPNVQDWDLTGPHDEGGKHWKLAVSLADGKEHMIRITEDGDVSEIKPEQIAKKADLKKSLAPATGGGYSPADYEHTGDYNVVSHMTPGTIFKGADGHHYKLHGDEWIAGKKGPVKAAHLENLATGTHKNVPYFAIHGKEYEVHQLKGSGPVVKPKTTSADAAFADIMKSVEDQHGSIDSVAGKNIVVTGAIPGHTRTAVHALIEKAGGTPHSSVGASTHVLVTGDKVGATKINAAKKKGVTVIPWGEFKHLVESELGVRPVRLALTLGDLEVAEAAGDVDQIVRLRARARVLEERDYSSEERRKMAARGEALSDGSFPIKDRTDLSNAITRLPQAHDKGKALRHIHKRAAALGAKDLTKKHEARLHA